MKARIALVLALVSLAAAARADTENVRQWQSQVEFRPVGNASGGASARRLPVAPEPEGMFQYLDIDGDGLVSKAEAAGNAQVTLGFDRADRNRDGKLSFKEYDSIGKPRASKKKVARGQGSASAGATEKKN